MRGYPLVASAQSRLAGQTFFYKKDTLGVQCARGVFIIETLKPEGKNEIPIKAYLNGHKEIIGAILS
jgi:methionyl-tRNA formyltransferase